LYNEKVIKQDDLKEKSKQKLTGKTNKKKEKGVIAAYALIAAAVVATLLGGLLVFVSSSQRRSSDEISRQQALQVAESGIYFYKWYLAHETDGLSAAQIRDFWESGTAFGLDEPYEQDVTDKDGTAIGRYQININLPSLDSTIVWITSKGWTYVHPEIEREVRVRFRRPSWSEYAVLANDVMRFGTDTYVTGPIHSNNGIRFDGVANNMVTSSVEQYEDPDSGAMKPGVWTSQPDEHEVFLAGYDFPVGSVDFNGVTADLANMETHADSDGIYLAEETFPGTSCRWVRIGGRWRYRCQDDDLPVVGYHLTLRTDDQVEVRRVFNSGSISHYIYDESDADVMNLPGNGLIFVKNHAWVDGQVSSARVTIAAADLDEPGHEDIFINNDIQYTHHNGEDIIGLIAEGDISVGLYSEDDLEIDAALLAQNGRVGRDYYTSGDSSEYYKRDEITVTGSVATNQRYGFSWVCGGTWCSGYDIRNIHFDNNLLYSPPPFFPTGTQYELDLWEDL